MIKLSDFHQTNLPKNFTFIIGTDSAHRQALVQKLNTEYAKAVADNYSQADAYEQLVYNLSYRLLDGFTYEKKPRPIRTGRGAKAPPEIDGSVMNLLDWEIQTNSPVINMFFVFSLFFTW